MWRSVLALVLLDCELVDSKNVLCLAGGGQSASSFQGSLQQYTVHDYCVYMDGTIGYNVWHPDNKDGTNPSLDDSAAIAHLDTEFDDDTVGIVGYSQGCSALLGYVAHLLETQAKRNLQFVVCLNGYVPNELVPVYQRIQSQVPMNVSSLTFIGGGDPFGDEGVLPGASTQSVPGLFANALSVTGAGYGHSFPMDPAQAYFDVVEDFMTAFLDDPLSPPPSPLPPSPPPSPLALHQVCTNMRLEYDQLGCCDIVT